MLPFPNQKELRKPAYVAWLVILPFLLWKGKPIEPAVEQGHMSILVVLLLACLYILFEMAAALLLLA